MKYLFEAVRLGSVRGAAELIGVNASVVSRQIGLLEKDLGIALLERKSRGVRATGAGELLVRHYRQRLADGDDIIVKLREIQGLKRGHIDIVLGEGFIGDLMTGPLGQFWQLHDQLSLSLDLAGTNDVVAAVAEDRYHIGLVFNPKVDPRIRSWRAVRQPICLIVRPDHPLAGAVAGVNFTDIAGLELGLMHAGYGTRQVVAMAESAERLALTAKLTTSSIDILRHFIKTGLGVSLLPAFAVAGDLADKSLVAVQINHPVLVASQAHIITRLGRELPHAASRLMRDLTAHMQAFREL